MELTKEQIKQIYDEYIGIMNKDGTQCRILEIEKDYVHALLEFTHPKVKIYQLMTIREQPITGHSIVQILHSWGEEEYPLARIAFRCFCHEEPEEIGKMWENNRQIALYSDEARHKDELISELIDRSGAL